ncbi:MAG: ribosome small subunit-dependent GTPase A [Ignavibacteriales bacterium]|nr:ribosome small subunit-dependent GTPase A [Ignavibacteriales bacterium]
MNNNNKLLDGLGFSNWFKDKAESVAANDMSVARVISVNKNNYIVYDGRNEMLAELTGKFMFSADSSLDYPTVGDWVSVRLFNEDTFAVIHDVLPRQTLLKRKTAGDKMDYQLIAANVDSAIIVQSLDFNFNLRRLERYLVMIHESGIKPVILLSKADLVPPEEVEAKKAAVIKTSPETEIITFSNNTASDVEIVNKIFIPGKTYCLLGSSGVGKTTLINNLIHQQLYKTLEVREKDGRGKHTTTRRELIILNNGALLIDNPGMRELGVIAVESGLDETFSEITELSDQCRFADCTHTVEAGCAILAAVENGGIPRHRYANYIKMRKESAYNEMTYVEKRQKDKKFGKYINSVVKTLKAKQ